MDYIAFLAALDAHRADAALALYGEALENGRRYPLRVYQCEGRQRMVLTTGFHGEEPAGPLTLARHLGEIFAYARARGVALTAFPCINPSGFEARQRYNASGERPNNDLLRYEVAPGVWRGELSPGPGEPILGWRPYDGGPKETRALRAALERLPVPAAALDLHQDHALIGELAYAYYFGDRAPLLPLLRRSEPIVRDGQVDERIRTDPDGLIWYHDGSVTDYFHRRGARLCAALETTTRTPLDRSVEINLIWIRGFIDFAAERGP